jgi:hypothetical protein
MLATDEPWKIGALLARGKRWHQKIVYIENFATIEFSSTAKRDSS